MSWLIPIGCILTGIVAGASLVRYGMGLGARMIYEVKENLPVLNSDKGLSDTDQVNTSGLTDEDLEEI